MNQRFLSALAAGVLVSCLSACGQTTPVFTETAEVPAEPIMTEIPGAPQNHLRLTVEVRHDPPSGTKTYEVGESFPNGVLCTDIESVTIWLEDGPVPLFTALEENRITDTELLAAARRDAREGLCKETVDSMNGVSIYAYAYNTPPQETYTEPIYTLLFLNDVYELPSGEKEPVSRLYICSGWYTATGLAQTSFLDTLADDREDWGLTFDSVTADSQNLIIHITQQGGQQFGNLEITHLDLTIQDPVTGALDCPISTACHFDVTMNGETRIVFPLDAPLPSGDYRLSLRVKDHFDPDSLHPFTRDYHDAQSFNHIPLQVL